MFQQRMCRLFCMALDVRLKALSLRGANCCVSNLCVCVPCVRAAMPTTWVSFVLQFSLRPWCCLFCSCLCFVVWYIGSFYVLWTVCIRGRVVLRPVDVGSFSVLWTLGRFMSCGQSSFSVRGETRARSSRSFVDRVNGRWSDLWDCILCRPRGRRERFVPLGRG